MIDITLKSGSTMRFASESVLLYHPIDTISKVYDHTQERMLTPNEIEDLQSAYEDIVFDAWYDDGGDNYHLEEAP